MSLWTGFSLRISSLSCPTKGILLKISLEYTLLLQFHAIGYPGVSSADNSTASAGKESKIPLHPSYEYEYALPVVRPMFCAPPKHVSLTTKHGFPIKLPNTRSARLERGLSIPSQRHRLGMEVRTCVC
jgi:hypothetical protein